MLGGHGRRNTSLSRSTADFCRGLVRAIASDRLAKFPNISEMWPIPDRRMASVRFEETERQIHVDACCNGSRDSSF